MKNRTKTKSSANVGATKIVDPNIIPNKVLGHSLVTRESKNNDDNSFSLLDQDESFVLNFKQIIALAHLFEFKSAISSATLWVCRMHLGNRVYPKHPVVDVTLVDGTAISVSLTVDQAVYLIFHIHAWDIKWYVGVETGTKKRISAFAHTCELNPDGTYFLKTYFAKSSYFSFVEVSTLLTRSQILDLLNDSIFIKSRFFRMILFKNYCLDYLNPSEFVF